MLAAVEAVGDAPMRALVLEKIAEMQMLGIRQPKQVDDTLMDAIKARVGLYCQGHACFVSVCVCTRRCVCASARYKAAKAD